MEAVNGKESVNTSDNRASGSNAAIASRSFRIQQVCLLFKTQEVSKGLVPATGVLEQISPELSSKFGSSFRNFHETVQSALSDSISETKILVEYRSGVKTGKRKNIQVQPHTFIYPELSILIHDTYKLNAELSIDWSGNESSAKLLTNLSESTSSSHAGLDWNSFVQIGNQLSSILADEWKFKLLSILETKFKRQVFDVQSIFKMPVIAVTPQLESEQGVALAEKFHSLNEGNVLFSEVFGATKDYFESALLSSQLKKMFDVGRVTPQWVVLSEGLNKKTGLFRRVRSVNSNSDLEKMAYFGVTVSQDRDDFDKTDSIDQALTKVPFKLYGAEF